jgi:hypothetical protein
MNLIYPTEKEVVEFFESHNDFITVHRISELLVAPHHNNLQEEEWKHIKKILHDLKSKRYLLVENEGKNIYDEKFSSTPDRIARYKQTKTDDLVDDDTEINKSLLTFLCDPRFPLKQREFKTIQDHFPMLNETELRKKLTKIGSIQKRRRQDNAELWECPVRNSSVNETKMIKDRTSDERQANSQSLHIAGDYIAGDKVGRDKVNKTDVSTSNKYYWSLLIPVVVIVLGYIITEGKSPTIFKITAVPTSSVENTATTSSDDLRTHLLGSVFDLARDIQKIDKDIFKDDFVKDSVGKTFEATGTISQIDKFENGEIWITLRGMTTDNNTAYIECHFDASWEKTLRSLLSTNKDEIRFYGEVGYYAKGWLVAQKCKVLEVKN